MTGLALAEVPILKQIILGVVKLLVMLIRLLGAGLSKISAFLCTFVVFSIYVAFGGLGFLGFTNEVFVLKNNGLTLDTLPILFAFPLLLHHQAKKSNPDQNNWLTVCFYHNIALWLMRYIRYSIVTDLLISLICTPKLLMVPFAVIIQLGLGEGFDNYDDLGVEVCAGLSVLLTPLQITLFMLMTYINA